MDLLKVISLMFDIRIVTFLVYSGVHFQPKIACKHTFIDFFNTFKYKEYVFTSVKKA